MKILTANPGPSTAYSGVGKVKNAGVPLVAINTTAGTAAEMTSNAVIIDSARKVKEVIIDPNIIPDIAVDDASVMLEIPASVTAATGMDALTHAVEAYVSVGAHPLTDANALEAIRLINVWLPKAVDDGHNLEAREQMAFGQYRRHGVQQRRFGAGSRAGAPAGRNSQPAARRLQRYPAANCREL